MKKWYQLYWRIKPGLAVLSYVSHGEKFTIVRNISKRLDYLLVRKGYSSITFLTY